MSRDAYEGYFGVAAPADALFGVDMAYPQAYSSPSTLDYNFCKGYWLDVHTWADFVCIRTSYGGSGDDGAQGLHFQIAKELSFAGAMGPYHFAYAGPGVQANYDNFISRSEPFVDQTSFDMMDYEAAPNVGAGFINQMCDMVEQKRQRTCFVYGGKSYLDAAGAISCEADKLWIAHYASSGSNPLQPTTDWSSWGAPLMPNQYGAVMPGIWQWSSLTAQHGHLDLNISTLPIEAFGGEDMAGLTPEQDQLLREIYNRTFATENRTAGNQPLHEQTFNAADAASRFATRGTQILERINTEIWIKSTGGSPNLYDDIRKGLVKLDNLSTGGIDVTALSRLIVASLTPILAEGLSDTDISKMTRAMADLLANLLAQAKK
jgi:hypothetical protein